MRYEERAPSADLAPYVQCIWELEDHASAFVEPIFPDGRIELVIHLADLPRQRDAGALQPRAMIVGQMLTATRLEPVARMHALGVRFTPSGARAWVALPLHEISGRFTDACAVRGTAASRFQAAVEQGRSPHERFMAAEAALRLTLCRNAAPSDSIRRAVQLIEREAGMLTIDALARACTLSPRQLERRFLDEVGITPKALARVVRFQRAVRGLRSGASPADVAAACGFADQPHLAREFRRFAGLPARDVDLAHVAFLQDTTGARPAHS
jgi:methylphosphotriester-DNA--protein-cysteine methyltransferase